MSDTFGDFRFDNLERNSGSYLIEIAYPNKEVKTIEAELRNSLNMGTIWL
jgi:hypothetical protein